MPTKRKVKSQPVVTTESFPEFNTLRNEVKELRNLIVDEYGQLKIATKEDMLPILETYRTVGTVGRWGKILLGTIATILTLVIAVRQLWSN